MISTPSWHTRTLKPKPLNLIVNILKDEILNIFKDEEYSIAFSGYSGSLIAGPLSILLDKPLIIVRKEGDNHHSYGTVQGENCNKYIIVDDLMCSGDTIRRIINEIEKTQCVPFPKCLGVFLHYNGSRQNLSFEETNIPIYNVTV